MDEATIHPMTDNAKAILDAMASFELAACTFADATINKSRDEARKAELAYDRTAKHLFSLITRRAPTAEEMKYLKGLTD